MRSLASLAALVAATPACMQTPRAAGDDCLKDQDCASGVCASFRCVGGPANDGGAAPTTAAVGDGAAE